MIVTGFIVFRLISKGISTSKNEATASGKYGKNGYVKIKLTKVNSKIVNFSKGVAGKSARISNYAKKDSEVLIEGHIPQDAIISVHK